MHALLPLFYAFSAAAHRPVKAQYSPFTSVSSSVTVDTKDVLGIVNAMGGLEALNKIQSFEYHANEYVPLCSQGCLKMAHVFSQYLSKRHSHSDLQTFLAGSVCSLSRITDNVVS